MTVVQSAKALIRSKYAALDAAGKGRIAVDLASYYHPDVVWHGMHPFDTLQGFDMVAERFWTPLKNAVNRMQRRMDVFFAGQNSLESGVWVVSMGHLMGLFDASWLNIRPTGKMVMLRYCAFHRVEGDVITEEALFCDIPHLMMQAGYQPFAPQTAAHLVQPGPMTHDGLLFESQPDAESVRTLATINAMIGHLGQWNSGLSLEDELALSWADDMIWWGPAGIGATYTIERYARQHSGPFRASFAERSKTRHIARLAEGNYGGFFGWPNFSARHTGGFMGMPSSDKPGEFRVIDIYRREGDKLVENWVFIDLLHFWNMEGVDILSRCTGIGPSK